MRQRLSQQQREVIRRTHLQGSQQWRLAEIYGISGACVSYIVNGRKVLKKGHQVKTEKRRADPGGAAPLGKTSDVPPPTPRQSNLLDFRRFKSSQSNDSIDEAEKQRQIEQYLAEHGVTACPAGVAFGAYPLNVDHS